MKFSYRMILASSLMFVSFAISACQPNSPEMPLLTAIDQDNLIVVKEHIVHGTDLNEEYIPDPFPFEGAGALHLAVLKNNSDIVNALIEGGADIDLHSKDESRSTPLIWAAFWAIPEMVQLLVEAGASMSDRDSYGSNALTAAYAENPFILVDDLEKFKENRMTIIEYLSQHDG